MAAPEASTMEATIAQISGIGETDCQDSGEDESPQGLPLSPMGISAPTDARLPGETPEVVWCTHSTQPEDKALGLRAKHPQRRIPVLFLLGRNEVGTTAYTEEEMKDWTLEVIPGDPLRIFQDLEHVLGYPKEYAMAMFDAILMDQLTNGKALSWTRWRKYVSHDDGSLYITVRCHKCRYSRQLSLHTLFSAPLSLPLLSCAEMRVPCLTRQEKPLRSVTWHRTTPLPTNATSTMPCLPPGEGEEKPPEARISSTATPRTPSQFFIGDALRQALPEGKEGMEAILSTLLHQLATPKPTEEAEEPRSREVTSVSWDPLTTSSSYRRTPTEEASILQESQGVKTMDEGSTNVTWGKEEPRTREDTTRLLKEEPSHHSEGIGKDEEPSLTPQRNLLYKERTSPYHTTEEPQYPRGRRWQSGDRRHSSPYGRSSPSWSQNRSSGDPLEDFGDPWDCKNTRSPTLYRARYYTVSEGLPVTKRR